MPADVERALVGLHDDYRAAITRRDHHSRRLAGQRLASYARRGRERGWSLADLAEPLGITPEGLRQLLVRFGDAAEWSEGALPDFPTSTVTRRRRRPKPVKPRPGEVDSDKAARLRLLAPEAAKTKGSTPLDAPERAASEEFSALIKSLHDDGHSWQQIADASGLSMAGVRMRAARHGYKAGPPKGVPAYRGVYRKSPRADAGMSADGPHVVPVDETAVEVIPVTTVELSARNSSLLTSYLARHPGVTREAALSEALTLLRARDLESQYEQADQEWRSSGDALAWESVEGDGLDSEAWGFAESDDPDDGA